MKQGVDASNITLSPTNVDDTRTGCVESIWRRTRSLLARVAVRSSCPRTRGTALYLCVHGKSLACVARVDSCVEVWKLQARELGYGTVLNSRAPSNRSSQVLSGQQATRMRVSAGPLVDHYRFRCDLPSRCLRAR
eukprot:2131383-Pleurochrysis_carterae.AAC.2